MAIWYGNGTKTSYTYDLETYRLRRLLTVNLNNNEILQDLHYWFDPVGNITEIQDDAQQSIFFNNTVVSPRQQFTYDALYRLIQAQGRELSGIATFGSEDNWNDAAWQTTLKGDGNAVQNYTQLYTYDAVGNILELQHIATAGSYTRTYAISTDSNQLLSTTVGAATYTYQYDARGNMGAMPHLDGMHWNLNNELHQIENGTMQAFYQYSGGQRTRKYVTKGNVIEERIYLGSFEIYRKFDNGSLIIERTTVHVSDDSGRIAMLERRTIGSAVDDHNTAEQLTRYIYSNHLQSASLELDESGAIISYEEYHPYGTTSYQAMNASIHAVAKRYRYTGKERDEESGLYYHEARYYIPWLCRWSAVDTLQGEMPKWSSYNYGFCNPLIFNDPSGGNPNDTLVVQKGGSVTTDVNEAGTSLRQVSHAFVTIGETVTQSIHTTDVRVTSKGVAVQQIRMDIASRGDSVYASTTQLGTFNGSLTDAMAAFPGVDFSQLNAPLGTVTIGGETPIQFNTTAQANWQTLDGFDATKDGGPISWDKWLDRTQAVLDVAGLIPGIGEVADIASGVISLFRGNWGDAALSFAAAIPFVGTAIGGAKAMKSAKKATEGVYDIAVKNADDASNYIGQSKNMVGRIKSHFGDRGKLSSSTFESAQKYVMKKSTKYEREIYEQYIILNKYGGKDNLINKVNPVGGRFNLNTDAGLKAFYEKANDVIKKYNLPIFNNFNKF